MDTGELYADLCALVAAGLIAVTGTYPDLGYVLTPQGEAALATRPPKRRPVRQRRIPWMITPEGDAALAEYEASIRAEARELAMRRHAAAQETNVIQLFKGQGA